MMYKAVIVFLACHLALALALPAKDRSQGEQDVQTLIEELEHSSSPKANHDKVIKKTTITTVEEPESLPDEDKLREYMKDPKFAEELRKFLLQFLNMYNSLNKVQKGSTTSSKLINEENVDLQTLLKNPAFFSFLTNFFNSSDSEGGINGFLSQLFHQNKRPKVTTHTTQTIEELVNGHSRPEEVSKPHVTITHLETSKSDSQSSGTNPAEEVLNKLSGSSTTHESHPHVTTTIIEETSKNENSKVNDRFDVAPQVTITHVGDGKHVFHENNVVSSSEELLNELKHPQTSHVSESHSTHETHTTHQIHPTVVVHKIPVSTSSVLDEDWTNVHSSSSHSSSNKVENSAEFQQQAKNAQFQFATQINDQINGNFQQKAEIRQGGVLYGKYSYDDGNQWRTVYYQADSHGFQVTREEILPTHMTHLTGEASVQTLMDGNLVDYHITESDIASSKHAVHFRE